MDVIIYEATDWNKNNLQSFTSEHTGDPNVNCKANYLLPLDVMKSDQSPHAVQKEQFQRSISDFGCCTAAPDVQSNIFND